MTTRVGYKGFTFGLRTHAAILAAQKLHGGEAYISQGSYSTSVGASAGTHDLDGAVDLSEVGDDQIRDWRATGWAMWRRVALPGVWGPHNHGILIGTVELAWLARTQVTAYYTGRDGLANNGPDNTPWLRPNPIPVFRMADQNPKPPPSPARWPVWSGYPGKDKTGWGLGRQSIWNLRMQCALGVRGYVGAFDDTVTQTWTTAAQSALTRWQANHPTGGSGFDEAAWDALGALPTFSHDSFNLDNFDIGKVTWEATVTEMLLVLQGHAAALGHQVTRTWTARSVAAVKEFQKDRGLTVDGVVGPITWNALWTTHK